MESSWNYGGKGILHPEKNVCQEFKFNNGILRGIGIKKSLLVNIDYKNVKGLLCRKTEVAHKNMYLQTEMMKTKSGK